MRFSAFTSFGFFRFSSEPSLHELYYDLIPTLYGTAHDMTQQGSYEQSKRYAMAGILAIAHTELQHAANQANPLTAYDLLPLLENDFLLSPAPGDTVAQRGAAIAAAMLLPGGAKASNIVASARALLGALFLAYLPNPAARPAVVGGAVAGAGGAIALNVPNHGRSAGETVFVAGVLGTSEANGPWTVTVPDANTLLLTGSTFQNAYKSGGSVAGLPTVHPANPGAGPGRFTDVSQPAFVLQLVDPVATLGAGWCAYTALDTSTLPSITWSPGAAFTEGQSVLPTIAAATGMLYVCSGNGVTGATQPSWPSVVGATVVDGSVTWTCASTVAPSLKPGDQVVIDAGNTSQMEKVTITAFSTTPPVGGNCTPGQANLFLQATFTKSHDVGAPVSTGQIPYWWSTQRSQFIVLAAAAASDPVTRAKIDRLMAKIARGVDTWAIVAPTAVTVRGGTLGPLSAGMGMGTSPVGVIPFANSI